MKFKVKYEVLLAWCSLFVERVSEGNDDMGKVIKAAGTGWGYLQNLAGMYNKIAQWCGLPSVPKILTK